MNQKEEFKKNLTGIKLIDEPALSPSRASLFMNSKKQFIDEYVFGIEKPPTESMVKGTKVHNILELFFKKKVTKIEDAKWPKNFVLFGTEGYYKTKEAQNKRPEKTFIDEGIYEMLKEALYLINNVSDFKEIKDSLYSDTTTFEMPILNKELCLKGVVDSLCEDKNNKGQAIITEFKTSSDMRSFEFSKERYAIQQVFYSLCLDVSRFYFMLIETTYPYAVRLLRFPDRYLAHVSNKLTEEVIPRYKDTQSLIKEFYEKNGTPKRADLYSHLSKNKFLDFSKEVEAKPWDYK